MTDQEIDALWQDTSLFSVARCIDVRAFARAVEKQVWVAGARAGLARAASACEEEAGRRLAQEAEWRRQGRECLADLELARHNEAMELAAALRAIDPESVVP